MRILVDGNIIESTRERPNLSTQLENFLRARIHEEPRTPATLDKALEVWLLSTPEARSTWCMLFVTQDSLTDEMANILSEYGNVFIADIVSSTYTLIIKTRCAGKGLSADVYRVNHNMDEMWIKHVSDYDFGELEIVHFFSNMQAYAKNNKLVYRVTPVVYGILRSFRYNIDRIIDGAY